MPIHNKYTNVVIAVIVGLVLIAVVLGLVFGLGILSGGGGGGGSGGGGDSSNCPHCEECTRCDCSDDMDCFADCYLRGCCTSCDCPEPTNGGPKWCGPPNAPVCNQHCKILDDFYPSSYSTPYCCDDGCCKDCDGTIVYDKGEDASKYAPEGKQCEEFKEGHCKNNNAGHYIYDGSDNKYQQCHMSYRTPSDPYVSCNPSGVKCMCNKWKGANGETFTNSPYCNL